MMMVVPSISAALLRSSAASRAPRVDVARLQVGAFDFEARFFVVSFQNKSPFTPIFQPQRKQDYVLSRAMIVRTTAHRPRKAVLLHRY